MKVGPLFISYASEDGNLASHVLSFLESRGLKCWMAPRDIRPAADWAVSIIDGIDSSSGMVLILSRYSNDSPQVRRELERAVSRGMLIYPLVVESIELSKWMQYYISAHQWHDASDVSMSRRLEELLSAIRADRSDIETGGDLDSLSSLLADDLASLSAELDASGSESERLLPGERRKVSVLHITAALSDRDTPYAVKTAVSKTVSNLVERYVRFYGGVLEQLPSEGHRCVFGLEQVHEDDGRRALSCGIGVLGGLLELNSVLRRKNLRAVFGLGIASGMVRVDDGGDAPSSTHGEVLLSARELADDASGSLLVTGAFHHAYRGDHAWEEHSKGVYRLSESSIALPGSRAVSIHSPFVGREREISRLVSLLGKQEAGTEKNSLGGSKHLVTGIKGEAGIGKSRLVHEFIEKHTTGDEFRVLRGQTLSFAQPPYWAWTTLLRNLLEIEYGSDPDYERLLTGLRNLRVPEELLLSAPFLASLLSIRSDDKRLDELDERAIALETRIAFSGLIKALSGSKKLIVVLEDVHWLDANDRSVLEFVIENCVTDIPVIFLLLYRPEREDGSIVEFLFNPAYAVSDEIEVVEVDERASGELARQLLGNMGDTGVTGISSETCDFLLKRSCGNPFFLEELVYDLVERGHLVEQGGEWKLDLYRDEHLVPDSLNGLIRSRLERLPESWRSVLQNSSVLGMEFQLKLYWKLVNKLFLGRCHLDVFDGLEHSKMLVSRMSAFEKMYLFRHILVHNTAYASILEGNLKKLHRAAAESIEELFPSERERVSGILMHHYDKAGEHEKAIEWGFKALKHYSGEEALKISYRLEDLLEETMTGDELGESVFKLLSYRDKSLDLLCRREEQGLTIERMVDSASRSNSDYRMAVALKKRGALARVTGRLDDARADWERSLELIRRTDDKTFEGIVLGNLGALDLNQGRVDIAVERFEKALEIHRRDGDQRSEGIILMNLGIIHKNQGRLDEALACYEQTLETARKVGDRRTAGDVLGNIGSLLWSKGDLSGAGEYYRQSMETQQEIGNRRSAAITLSNLAVLHQSQGLFDESLDDFSKALDAIRDTKDRFMEGNILSNLGVLQAERGEMEQAKGCYEQALEIHRGLGNRPYEGITLGNIGNVLFKLGRMDQARTAYAKALEVLREVRNRAEEANVLSNLGCLLFGDSQFKDAKDCHQKAFEIAMELKLPKSRLPGFVDLHGKMLAEGFSMPWPDHWEPVGAQQPIS